MENTDSLTQFFYNIVPGILFIKGLELLTGYHLTSFLHIRRQEGLIIIFYLSFGLFVGFIFQGFTKIIRNNFCLDRKVFEIIKNKKNNISLFENAEKLLKKKKLLGSDENTETVFYLIHNYLLAKGLDSQGTFFADRVAFWSNIFFTSFFLVLIKLYYQRLRLDFTFIFLLLLLFYSWKLFKRYLENKYDTVLKTFVMVKEIEKKDNK